MSKQLFIDQLDQAISRILSNPDGTPPSVDASLVELLQAARDLRELPRPDFKARLRAELEKNISTMSTKIGQFRPGFRTITPYLLPPNADFVDFAKNVFGAVETTHHETGPGRFHAEMKIGDSMLMVGVGAGRSMPMTLSVYVPNADEVFKRALDAGCIELEGIRSGYGDRFGTVQDSSGNQWVIATHLGANYIREGRDAVSVNFVMEDTGKFIDFIKQVFNAQELERYEWPGGMYASMRIGDSVVGVNNPKNHEWMKPMPSMIYMYVPDCDAVYDRAIRAGATSIYPPTDHSYGDRNGGVTDAWGNQWFMSTPL